MSTYIFKLEFDTQVHFGAERYNPDLTSVTMACHSDTLFAAICNEMKLCYGEQKLADFILHAKSDEFQMSDTFPYIEDIASRDMCYYLPKPIMNTMKDSQLTDDDEFDKKALKKIDYIRVDDYQDFVKSLTNSETIARSQIPVAYEEIETKVRLDRNEDSLPYQISAYRFKKGAGLYFLMETDDQHFNLVCKILESLGLSGIGGKKSQGYGKFHLANEPYMIGENNDFCGVYDSEEQLYRMLHINGTKNIALGLIYPCEEDLISIQADDGYSLIERKGFVTSQSYADYLVKRKDAVAFAPGSSFTNRLSGCIIDVRKSGKHPVYRYGKGMFLGVEA